MAGSAGRDKQTLAANHLLLGQGGGLALLVHLKFEMAMDATRNNQVNTAPIPSITPVCQPESIVEIAACVKHKIKKYYETSRTLARPLFLEKLCISNQSFKGSPKNECKPRRLYHWRKSNATAWVRQVRFRHRDHHIFDISEAGLSEGQQHKAKHQATSKAQSSLGHAIVLHAWCSWQLSTWHLAWCLRCRGSSGALSHEDQMHGRYAQAAGQEQRGVAGHFSKTRGKPHSLRCLEKSRSWNIAWNSSEGHVDSSWQRSWSSDAAPISLQKVSHKPLMEEETMENCDKWLISYRQEIFEWFFAGME